jgi:pyruvate dehydrogenase (quinone)
MQEADAEMDPFEGGLGTGRTPDTKPGYTPPRVVPPEEDLRRAAAVLNEATKPVLLVGVGAIGAGQEVLTVADLLGAPIVKTLPGKAVVPDDHPLAIGGLGLLGTEPAEEHMDDADTILMVGTNFPYTAYLPVDRRVVQIDLDPVRSGSRIPTEVPLVGEAHETLRRLLPLLDKREDRSWLEKAQKGKRRWQDDMAALESPDREPIQPQYLARVIDRLADDDAVLTSDSGTVATWAARHFDIRGRRQFYLSGNLATMAPGLPYAMATQVAYPGRQCIAFVGDGGFAMLMAELHTAAWHELPIKVVVCNNGLLGQILWEQMALGYPEVGVRYPAMDFAPWAQACGALGLRIDKPGDVEGAIKEVLAHRGPALVDVHVNPDEPPMPPKIHYDEATKFATSFLKGTPRRATIASTLFRDRLDQMKR